MYVPLLRKKNQSIYAHRINNDFKSGVFNLKKVCFLSHHLFIYFWLLFQCYIWRNFLYANWNTGTHCLILHWVISGFLLFFIINFHIFESNSTHSVIYLLKFKNYDLGEYFLFKKKSFREIIKINSVVGVPYLKCCSCISDFICQPGASKSCKRRPGDFIYLF